MPASPPLRSADADAPVVTVRSVRRLSGSLVEIQIRTHAGKVRRVIMARDIATTGNVAMTALAVATLADKGRA